MDASRGRRGLAAAGALAASLWCLAAAPEGAAQGETPVFPAEGLVGLWLAEGDACDAAGGRNGSVAGGAAFGPGVLGQGFRLDGTDDFVDLAGAQGAMDFRDGQSFTLSAWVRIEGNDRRKPVFDTARYGIEAGVNEDVYFYVCTGVWACSTAGNGRPLPAGEWHQVAGIYRDEGERQWAEIWVDGERAGRVAADPIIPYQSYPRIGSSWHMGGLFFQGGIDEAAVWNRALSGEEMRAVFAAGRGGARRGEPLDEAALAAAVEDLGREAGDARAAAAIWRLAGGGDGAVPLLARVLEYPDGPGEAAVARLIDELDADSWEVREGATQRLLDAGPPALPALRLSLEKNPPEEARARLAGIVEAIEASNAGRPPRDRRAVAVLERVGSAGALEVLDRVSLDAFDETVAAAAREAADRVRARTGSRRD